MTSPRTPESGPNLRTVEVLAEHVSHEFSRKWRDLGMHTDAYDLGKVKEGEYYRTAGAFAKKHGFSETHTLELVNFEIHRGFDIPLSAEFKLLATPMPSELLDYVTLLQNDLPIAEVASQADTSPVPKIIEEHIAIEQYERKHPGLISRIVLTRTLGDYKSIKDTCEHTEKFLQEIHVDDFTTQQEVDEIHKFNRVRIYKWKQHVRTIEKMVELGVIPLSPDEYTAIVESYLVDLIKHNEDRLNPFSNKNRPSLPGTIALQAFFENHTGKQYPGTKNDNSLG